MQYFHCSLWVAGGGLWISRMLSLGGGVGEGCEGLQGAPWDTGNPVRAEGPCQQRFWGMPPDSGGGAGFP